MVKALINYKLLKKARIYRRLSLEKASKGIIDIELLRKAEKGIETINFEELKLLAERYRKNITYFYLDKEPSIIQNLKSKYYEYKIKFIKYLIRKWRLDNEFMLDV